MFDVGFSELILLFIIGLLVLGPEKLPQVANKLGSWVGQARRMTRMLKSQIEEELEFSKVRESVNQPLSSIMDKPKAKPQPDPKPEPKSADLNYEEGEDDESGFGETGHADAEKKDTDRPVPDPAAPRPPQADEAPAGEPTAAGERGDESASEPADHGAEDDAGSQKTTTAS